MRATESAPPWVAGWWRGARRCDSAHYGPRPGDVVISLIVVHCISLPPGSYRGRAVEALFTGRLDTQEHPYFQSLTGLRVSAHFFIRRRGAVVQFVSCDDRAWHAGASVWQGRPDCNDYSVGIELEGREGGHFSSAQYEVLQRLIEGLAQGYPIQAVVGHEHVAPGRKSDPGRGFDWARLRQSLRSRQPHLVYADA